MLTYIVRRLLYSIPVLVATSFIIFCGVSLAGDPLTGLRMLPNVSHQTIEKRVKAKHLDKPVYERYGYWVKEAVTDKFGTEVLTDRKIWPDITRVLPHTIELILSAELIALFFAIAIGVYSAIRQYSPFDYAATTFSFLGFAMPVFWLALILQIIFTDIFLNYHVRIFYTSTLSSPNPGSGLHFLIDRAQHLALPIITLAILSVAQYSRFLRASMLEVINSDYVRTARAKGLIERRVTMGHAFRNALIPLSTVVALNFGAIFGGAVVTESIFQLDGMGFYFINKLATQDVYPLMAWLMITAVMTILFNLLADIVLGYLDPRVRFD